MDKHEIKKLTKNQDGQTLVEFILLLAGITMISFSFMRLVNSNIADRWQAMAQMVLDDKSQTLEIR